MEEEQAQALPPHTQERLAALRLPQNCSRQYSPFSLHYRSAGQGGGSPDSWGGDWGGGSPDSWGGGAGAAAGAAAAGGPTQVLPTAGPGGGLAQYEADLESLFGPFPPEVEVPDEAVEHPCMMRAVQAVGYALSMAACAGLETSLWSAHGKQQQEQQKAEQQ